MSKPIKLFIDIRDTEPASSDLEMLEETTHLFAEEIQAGRLVKLAELTREEEVPEGSMSVLGGFVPGVVTALISPEGVLRLVDFILKRFETEKMTFIWKADGKEVSFDYTSHEDFERKLEAVKEFSDFLVKVKKD